MLNMRSLEQQKTEVLDDDISEDLIAGLWETLAQGSNDVLVVSHRLPVNTGFCCFLNWRRRLNQLL
jgi:broad specificity phosphatase PhoE